MNLSFKQCTFIVENLFLVLSYLQLSGENKNGTFINKNKLYELQINKAYLESLKYS